MSRKVAVGVGLALCAGAVVLAAGQVAGQGRHRGGSAIPAPVPAGQSAVAAKTAAREGGQYRGLKAPDAVAGAAMLLPAESGWRRDLAMVYARRAYPGAPPVIPHPVAAESEGSAICASCHEKGGWVPKYGAFAPLTPHPELTACRQCHVPQDPGPLFRETEFVARAHPEIRRPWLPGAPPPIPHDLQMRERCVACHAGPAAAFEVRSSHPDRPGCRQCHVHAELDADFARPGEAR